MPSTIATFILVKFGTKKKKKKKYVIWYQKKKKKKKEEEEDVLHIFLYEHGLKKMNN